MTRAKQRWHRITAELPTGETIEAYGTNMLFSKKELLFILKGIIVPEMYGELTAVLASLNEQNPTADFHGAKLCFEDIDGEVVANENRKPA